jgi:predicted membrane chloride channel (bestrophin family)
MEHLNDLTPHFAAMEQWTQATLIARLKQEQSNLRRTLIRIHTIRETSFVASGYLLADMVTLLLCIGLVLVRIEPFYESLFFVSVIAYLMIYLLMLIRDLDNPFGYYENNSGEDVSLKPLADTAARLAKIARIEAASGIAPAAIP